VNVIVLVATVSVMEPLFVAPVTESFWMFEVALPSEIPYTPVGTYTVPP